jgi:hypothetical protein
MPSALPLFLLLFAPSADVVSFRLCVGLSAVPVAQAFCHAYHGDRGWHPRTAPGVRR